MACLSAPESSGHEPEPLPDESGVVLIVPSDGPALGPFYRLAGAYPAPYRGLYTTHELAQNYAALYYLQYEVWTHLRAVLDADLRADVNMNCVVDFGDLTAVLQRWGETAP